MSTQATCSLVHIPRAAHASGPTASLLTVAPIQALHDELLSITSCESHLRLICLAVFICLRHEPKSAGLQNALESLNDVLNPTMEKVHSILVHLRIVYKNHSILRGLPDPITKEDPQIFFNPTWQHRIMKNGKEGISACEEVLRRLREDAIPLLPNVLKERESFTADFLRRRTQRDQSKIPALVLDLWLGPAIIKISEVEELPKDMTVLVDFDKAIPPFLEHLQAQFRRLCEAAEVGIDKFGYSTEEDLKRLYKDRWYCSKYLERMSDS